MKLIEVKNLGKTYSSGDVETAALRGVSFQVNKGEFVAVMGPSGSGKSTLLHILGFLERQTRGTYVFEGKTIDDYSEKEVARMRNMKMGFVFQAFHLLARTSVFENVQLPLLYSDVKKSEWEGRAKKAIEAVDLSRRISHLPSQLSGGEKQRVAIARALVNDPDVIFADEPTGNLDSESGQGIMEVIGKLNDQGRTIFVITHEGYTAGYAKRVIQLLDGKVEKDVAVNNRTQTP